MYGNLTGRQIVWIIVGIVVLIWFISWLTGGKKRSSTTTVIKGSAVPPQPQQYPLINQQPYPLVSQQYPLLGNVNPQYIVQPGQQYQQQPHIAQQPVHAQVVKQQQHKPQPMTHPIGPEIDQQENPFTLYYFYSPHCVHCQKFEPAWRQVAENIKQLKSLAVKKIDVTSSENENLAFYYNITGYPTVILVTPNRNIEYTGNRSPQDLMQFIASNINEYAPDNQYAQDNQYVHDNQYSPLY